MEISIELNMKEGIVLFKSHSALKDLPFKGSTSDKS